MRTRVLRHAVAFAMISMPVCAVAQAGDQSAATANGQRSEATGFAPTRSATADPRFDQFVPRPAENSPAIDYSIWNEALRFMVLGMGTSLRESSSRPSPSLGSRQTYGHDSLYRLEGNRIVFSFLDDDIIASFTTYREDLEALTNTIDIASLNRNEQLAFWLNLHNVAVIEQIAKAYPVSQPSRMEIGDSGLTLDEAPFITVAGVAMSPKDIRTKIVYQNWQDPRVIYGFFRGDIGGPSIQREAFTAFNVRSVLEQAGAEFVNSLRGTQKRGKNLQVSSIYEEARPYFFVDWPSGLRAHLRVFAKEKVLDVMDNTTGVRSDFYEYDIADLANGDREPNYGFVTTEDGSGQGRKLVSFRVTQSVQRLLGERSQKLNELFQRGELTPRVTIIDVVLPGQTPEAEEVE